MDSDLRSKIDTPDLDDALARDQDGSFGIVLQKYLAEWKSKVQAEMSRGVPAAEYQALSQLAKGMESADRILLFLIATKTSRTKAR
jgi:hypothetical protein